MGAILSYSVISLRRLGGAPDLRVPCVFGQRLNGYHPVEGSIVVFNIALVPVFAEPRIGTMEKLGDVYGKLVGAAVTQHCVTPMAPWPLVPAGKPRPEIGRPAPSYCSAPWLTKWGK